MKKAPVLFIFFLCAIAVQAHHLLQTRYPRQLLETSIVRPGKFAPVPIASSRFWKENMDERTRNGFIDNGRPYLGKPWTAIPLSVFQEYSLHGNRSNYEGLSFALRRQLACMVMAECMQDSGVFIKDIVKGLHYFVSETWWGIPAHYPKAQPDADLQVVDLFNAETANLLVWTCYMLEKRIKAVDKDICNTIRKEVRRRVLIPARTTDYDWKRYSWNHNTWTCANWLSCILFCETDRRQQIDDICQVLRCLDVFIDGYPEDGGCDEGVRYWDRAMGSLFECMQLLSLASNGQVTLPATDKIKAMADFIYRMYIGNGYYVNFAASNARSLPNINILYPLGVALNDQTMCRHAAFIAKQYGYISQPWKLFNQTGNFPTVSRELCFLRLMKRFEKEQAEEALVPSSWLPEREIFTARNDDGLFVAAKGGHNDESHNHNDIGNFIVYGNGQPLLIDLGSDTYTAKTFSSERYTLMDTRSAYHNVPLINGQEQEAGKSFRSSNATNQRIGETQIFSLDIAKAYPPKASVKAWERQFSVSDNNITVTERYELEKVKGPTILVLMTCHVPQQEKSGTLVFNRPDGKFAITYSPSQLNVETETVDLSKTAMKSSWGKQVYRIKMTVLSKRKKNQISYTISKLD